MGLLIGVGDFGIGDLIQKADNLYQMLLELCSDQLDWENILNKPTTVSGYGITNVYTKTQIDAFLLDIATGDHTHEFSDITNTPDTLEGYGITNAYPKDEADALYDEKAEKIHTHEIEDINGLGALLTGVGWDIVEVLPSTLKAKALYFVKPAGAARAKIYITTSGSSPSAIEMDAVSYAFLTNALLSKQNKFEGLDTEYVKGNGETAPFNKAAIGLSNVSNLSPANMPISDATLTALGLKADDNAVLKKTGNQTKTSGVLTFALSPIVPTPSESNQAANKEYVDSQLETAGLWGETAW